MDRAVHVAWSLRYMAAIDREDVRMDNEGQGAKGGQDAGTTDSITENSPAAGTTDIGNRTGGPDGSAGGVTGTTGRGQTDDQTDPNAAPGSS